MRVGGSVKVAGHQKQKFSFSRKDPVDGTVKIARIKFARNKANGPVTFVLGDRSLLLTILWTFHFSHDFPRHIKKFEIRHQHVSMILELRTVHLIRGRV